MHVNQKIHILSRELIHIINDLENETKKIVLEHIHSCTECQHLYSKVMEVEDNYPKATVSSEIEIKPLKKLVQFNWGLKLLLISIRAVLLFYIIFSGLSFYDLDTSCASSN